MTQSSIFILIGVQARKAASSAPYLQRMQTFHLQAPQLLTLFFKEF